MKAYPWQVCFRSEKSDEVGRSYPVNAPPVAQFRYFVGARQFISGNEETYRIKYVGQQSNLINNLLDEIDRLRGY